MSYRDTTWNYSAWEINSAPGYSCTPQYVGITEASERSVLASPNPTKGKITIHGNSGPSVALHDQFGHSINVPALCTTSSIELDLTSLPDGMYFVTLTTKGGSSMIKIIKIPDQ